MEVITADTHLVCRDNNGKIIFEKDKVLISSLDYSTTFWLPINNDLKIVFGSSVHDEIQSRLNEDKCEEQKNCKKYWSHNNILRLIYYYKMHYDKIKSSTIKNDSVFHLISENLSNEGIKFSMRQCKDKMKYLKMKYMDKVDNMKTTSSGAEAVHYAYFEEMDEILGKNPNANHVALASSSESDTSLAGSSRSNIASRELRREHHKSSDDEDDEITPKKKKESREEAIERRHKERISAQNRALEVYKQTMAELLKKL